MGRRLCAPGYLMMQMPNLIPEPGSWFDRITTIVLANVMWFVFAVPIITLPAATAGLFAVLAPLVRGRDAEIFATFFGTMRRQWLKSTVIAVADVLIGAVLVANFSILNLMDPPGVVFWMFRSIYLFLAIAALMANLYLWPLLVLFDPELRQMVMLAIKFAFNHALWSLFVVGLMLLPLVLAAFSPALFSAVIAVSASVLIANWGAWRIIRQYVAPEDLATLSVLPTQACRSECD